MAKRGRGYTLQTAYNNVETLEKAVEKYFSTCKRSGKAATIERLAYELKCSDITLMRMKDTYEKFERSTEDEAETTEKNEIDEENLKFCRCIHRAYQRVKAADIERLKERGNSGDIFVAKNHGYSDKQEKEIIVSVEKLEDYF